MSIHQIARSVPVVRGFFMSVPQYHVGSVLENRLALQVGRILGKYCVRSVRSAQIPPASTEYFRTLDKDGVVAIPDFLPAPTFNDLMNEIGQLRRGLEFRPFRERDGRLSVARMSLRPDKTIPTLTNNLFENPLLRQIAGAVARTRPRSGPVMELTIYKLTDASKPDNDEENLLHADLHTPTVKCFYYLNDVEATNGAFIYARGSHQMNLARLKYEYSMSVRTARLRRGDRLSYGVEERAGVQRAVMTPDERTELGIVETQFPVKANTLVIANNVGFHRRGEFTSPQERASIVVNFRHYQKPFWS